MPRTFRIVLFSVAMMVVACKTDKPAGTKPDEATKVVDKPRERATPAEPAMPKPEPASDPAATGSNTELQNKGLAMMQRMSDLFATHGSDCEKLAAEIKTLVTENRQLAVELQEAEIRQTHEERAAFAARNQAVRDAAMAKMAPIAKTCRDNKNFLSALEVAKIR
jgi:hypothetical protein